MFVEEVKPIHGDAYCHVCDGTATKALVIVRGKANCGYCGHQVNLCRDHAHTLLLELQDIVL